jgi:flagellar biosynthesis protein
MNAPRDPNPTAVALRYASGDAAPVVVARGRGLVAEEIIRRAREAGVFVHESRELVGLLLQVDLDRHIPPELFLAVAQLLAWIHRVEALAAERPRPAPAATAVAAPRVSAPPPAAAKAVGHA